MGFIPSKAVSSIGAFLLWGFGTWSGEVKAAPPIGSIAAFPAQWLSASPDLYPIAQKPTPIQWQASRMVQIAARNPKQMILVEAHQASLEAAKAVVNYLVKHHKFPKNRFMVQENARAPWKDWVTVRSEHQELPTQAPSWNLPIVRTTLASAVTPEQIQELHGSPEISGSRGFVEFRPRIVLQWFDLQADPNYQDDWHATWVGIAVEGEMPIYQSRTSALEAGILGSYFTSLSSVGETDAQSLVTQVTLGGFLSYEFDPSALGRVRVKSYADFFGNWRKRAEKVSETPNVRSARVGLGVSTSFDDALRINFTGAYVFTERGIIQAGGELSHQLFTVDEQPWSISLGLHMSLARFSQDLAGRGQYQETWSQAQVGIRGSL